MVKIFFSSGQLGNQLFQIAAARKITREHETLVLIGFGESLDVIEFAPPNCRIIRFLWLRRGSRTQRILPNLAFKALQWLGNQLLMRNVVGKIRNSPEGPVETKSRLAISIALHEHFRENLIEDPSELRLTSAREQWALEWLDERQIHHDRNGIAQATFMHIRRGDYLEWPHPDCPAALDEEWFTRAIAEAKDARPRQPIIAFSDDPSWVLGNWKVTDEFLLFKGTFQDSFALMSMCNSGILSASTFSWWAAKLREEAKTGPFIAPMFWIGHRQEKWNGEIFRKSGFLSFV